MKLIHAADLHARESSWNEFKESIEHIGMAAGKHGAQLIALAGDIWDGGPVQNSAGSLFPDFVEAIRSLADFAPVAMVYGAPSRDVEGSLEIFESLGAKYSIKILRPGIAYSLKEGKIEELGCGNEKDAECIIFGFPEPSPKWLLANEDCAGGKGIEMKAKDALRTLCMATGCMRMKYPKLPCVIIAQGKIEGASIGKGMHVGLGQGLSFSKDDLKALKADYIAFGGIHEPQRIEGTRAWYAGSIYPLDFSEGHKAGCWAVTLASPGDPALAERVAFPHPIKRHLISSGECAEEVPGMHGECVWYEVRCSKEEAARLDPDIILSRLLGHGASKGSKVTLEIQPSEALRSPEIHEAEGFEKKLEVWAKSAGEKLGKSALEKARILARETAKDSHVAGNARFRIQRLVLRGAIGTWKKGKKDEVELDLAARGPGVIALAGRNGLGKTTLLENLHPWPRLLTREGPLRSHFRLPDSFRDLVLIDTQTGWKYRCLIRIRADIPSGTCEYWLFRDEGTGFYPLPGINGRLEPYETWVEKIFGKLEIYLRTAFIPQRPARGIPDMAEATKGERKALFGQLAGIRRLESYRLAAKEKAQAAAHEMTLTEAKASVYSDADSAAENARERITQHDKNLELLRERKENNCRELSVAQACFVMAKKSREEKARILVEREQASRDIVKAKNSERGFIEEIEIFRASLRKRDEARKLIDTLNAQVSRKKLLEQKQSAIEAVNRKATREYSEALGKFATLHDQQSKELDLARRNFAAQEAKIKIISEHLEKPEGDICPECGQVMPADRMEQIALGRKKLRAELEKELGVQEKIKEHCGFCEQRLEELHRPQAPNSIEFEQEAELEELARSINSIDIRNAVETISRATIAEERIGEARKKVAKLEKEIGHFAEIEEKCSRSLKKIEENLKEYGKAEEIEKLLQNLAATSGEIIREEERKKTAERDLIKACIDIEEKKKLIGRAKELSSEISDWGLLQKAAGPDGIQALELDTLAPSISEIATRLLLASGNQGTIDIRTARIGGKGTQQRQIEDFLIMYIDQEGNEQEISTLSGGESVWVRKAVYDAFEVIRARSTGLQFLTVVLDEADGALDAESRMRYLRIIEAAHSEAGRYQTIIITHSLELQSMASTCIAIESLGPAKGNDPEDLAIAIAA